MPELVVGEEAQAPLGPIPRRLLQPLERDARVSGDEQPRAVDAEHRLDRVLGSLVRPDEAEHERGAPVVLPHDVGAERRMRDHAKPFLG